MQVIEGPSHTRRMAKWLGFTAVVLILIGLGAYLAIPHAHSPNRLYGTSLAFLGVAVCLKEIIPEARNWVTGYWGEARVLRLLGDLPAEYIAVPNFVVPGSKRGDIDLVLLGPMGILTIEVKTFPGHILYRDGHFYRRQANGWRTALPKNPLSQARGHSRSLVGYLKEQIAVDGSVHDLPPIAPVVVFVDTDRLDIGRSTVALIRDRELVDYVQSLPVRLDDTEVKALADVLLRARAAADT